MKPSLSVIIGGEKPGADKSGGESSGIGAMLLQAIADKDAEAVEAALAAFCDTHAAEYETSKDEDEEA